MALGALNALNETGLSIPEDLAITSYVNLSFTEATNPPLITLEKKKMRLGKSCRDFI